MPNFSLVFSKLTYSWHPFSNNISKNIPWTLDYNIPYLKINKAKFNGLVLMALGYHHKYLYLFHAVKHWGPEVLLRYINLRLFSHSIDVTQVAVLFWFYNPSISMSGWQVYSYLTHVLLSPVLCILFTTYSLSGNQITQTCWSYI